MIVSNQTMKLELNILLVDDVSYPPLNVHHHQCLHAETWLD